ncbi:hypothetical protein ANCDUO_26231 [Ancylostoma duodenale]|uniref:Uncharacterized protein n=1 Tax=Ancylostoma duodenale TaxID=51022 RepID=A0A0C2C2E7_9BILA|nr:hypothetical protein ANCDUO_26231 [Ancylostoma duodenale]
MRHESLSKVLTAYCNKRKVHIGKEGRTIRVTT